MRQEPVGTFIADFLCRERMLAVEVDGVTHGEDHEVAYDAKRTAYLEEQGYRVMRVWNIEVFNNLDGVLNTILLAPHSNRPIIFPMNPSHSRNSLTSIYSSGLWACSMLPGPQTTAGMPICWNRPASVQ